MTAIGLTRHCFSCKVEESLRNARLLALSHRANSPPSTKVEECLLSPRPLRLQSEELGWVMIKKSAALFLLLAVGITGCSKEPTVQHKRDRSFFERYVNSASDFNSAEAKLQELKLVTSDDKYHMRYALFDNGKIFYQVDNLGSGTGEWSYDSGAVSISASRPYFDLDLFLTAKEAEGDALTFVFVDRFGKTSAPAQFHEPQVKKPLATFVPGKQGL